MNFRHTQFAMSRRQRVGLLFVLFLLSVSCSDSDPTTASEPVSAPLADGSNDGSDTGSPDDSDAGADEQPVFQVYSETGNSGMRVTYAPSTLSAVTDVEELEGVYVDLMACVGMTAATPPAILLVDEETLFYTREDGTDVRGYYDVDSNSVRVHADDIQQAQGNRFWWTRRGMIQYLIDVHGLHPDSSISPFLSCHWASS